MSRDDGRSRAFLAVVAITVLSLSVRVVGLGTRVFHWDEGRVGFWILRYHETGVFFYRPIIHGPFLPVVNDYLFAVLPPSDFAARLPVAVVGGVLPMAAWLFRDRLRDGEVVAFALLLAANPLLVYYSRFMRNDVLVAAFSLFALGFLVRAIDGGDLGNLYPAAAALALGFTAKENAVLYVVAWAGAGALLLDHGLFRETARGRPARAVVGDWAAGLADRVRAHGDSFRDGLYEVVAQVAGALVVFVVVVAFFYAPRPELWGAIADPTTLPDVFHQATFGSAEEVYDSWITGSHQDHDYFPYLTDYLETLVYGAPVVLVFGLLGFLVDRYGAAPGGYRDLVAFATYWGLASVVGYPIATDIKAPWAAVHAAVPLAIPAAVGLAYVVREGRRSLSAEDAVGTALAALVLLAAAAGVAGANAAYMNAASEEHQEVIQWAQPGNDLKESLERVQAVSESNEGTDVLFYGTRRSDDEVRFYVSDESTLDTPPPGGPAWHSRLPLPWYFERYGAEVTSTSPDADPAEALADAPPVVVAYDFDRSEVEPHLDGYTAREHRFKLWDERIVVFVEDGALAASQEGPGDDTG